MVTKEEVRRAVFSIDPLKAPGVDGIHAMFFQTQWDVVGDSVCRMVNDVLVY